MRDRPPAEKTPALAGPAAGKKRAKRGRGRRGGFISAFAGLIRKFLLFLALGLALLAAVEGAHFWWRGLGRYVSTDNAYVHAALTPVSAEIPGVVKRLLVRDNQPVREGDLLAVLGKRRLQAALEKAKAAVAVARARRAKSRDAASLKAELEVALADYREKELLLSYAEIRAPVAGYVEKSVDPGTYARPGRPLLVIVQLHKSYIRADFKEAELEGIHVGQPAKVVLDAYPSRSFRGRVESLYSGTAETFSLPPPENAAGNWGKGARRIPVKIRLGKAPPANFPLLVGMSAYVTVDTRIRRGPRLLAHPGSEKPAALERKKRPRASAAR